MKNSLLACALLVGVSLLAGCEETPVGMGTNSGEAAVAAKSTIAEGDVNTVSFNVPSMTCEGCAASVQEKLAAASGVEACTVNLESKLATVKVNPDTFKAEDALKALADAGYKDSTLKN